MKMKYAPQSQSLSTNNAMSDFLLNRNLTTGQNIKDEFQKWLDSFVFGLFITIEPTPCSPMKNDDVKQRIRKIDMEINRDCIGNESTKFQNKKDRFWLIGFFENGHRGRLTRHLHLLHYIPYHTMKIRGSEVFQRNAVKDKFQFLWSSMNYTNYLDESRPVAPVHIQNISSRKDSEIVSRYSSKEIHRKRNYDDYFFSF